MKVLVIGDESRMRKYLPDLPIVDEADIVVVERGASDAEVLDAAADAEFAMVDAVAPFSETLIKNMPNLKLVHSEGVAFNLIDIEAAKEHGVAVCNNAGVNAGGVAEQTILLMLACLRQTVVGDAEVRAARQIQMKERLMVEGIRELGDCRVGFIGFGAIAQSTAWRLINWGCEMLYNKRHPLAAEDEARLHVRFAEQQEIIESCDIVSMHVPVTDETRNMVNEGFLKRMKLNAVLINTARGEIVDQEALAAALENGIIGAAGLDTLSPEPVQPDNPLLNLSSEAANRIVFSPHIGGITEGSFYNAHRSVWENFARATAGEPLKNRII